MKYFLGIPTHVRHDLCRECVDSFLRSPYPPHIVYVIDNLGSFYHPDGRVRVICPPENLGVARSWNLLHVLCKPHPLVISNDDIAIKSGAMERCFAANEAFVAMSGWSCFYQAEDVWTNVGDYDENFWPAYFEDNDYAYRMKLAGYYAHHLPDATFHHGSATIKSLPEVHKKTMHDTFRENEAYYVAKWGGAPGREIYSTPFNT